MSESHSFNEIFRALLKEVSIRTAKSSGPGGQNVNKVATKAQLFFDPTKCLLLDETVKERLLSLSHEKGYLTPSKKILISNQSSRSQDTNKRAVLDRFRSLLFAALQRPRKRVKTKPPTAQRAQRLSEKKISSDKKKLRKKVIE